MLEAHDSEVLGLEYFYSSRLQLHLLASCSRDRLIHIYDVAKEYTVIQTLDEHSASVNAIRFVSLRPLRDSGDVRDVPLVEEDDAAASVESGGGAQCGQTDDIARVQLISCSADHSLLIRSLRVFRTLVLF